MLSSLTEIVEPLLEWYGGHARELPWREPPGSPGRMEPYRVWLSEIMLQQTRVEAVKDYYVRFLAELPDIPALAAAPEEQLLRLWQGLGYYNRVRTMQMAAQFVVAHYDGVLPNTYEKLRELPGFGDYTAGAVASIAFGIPAPAVDGNVLRVVTRLTACFEDVTKPAVKNAVAAALREAEPADRPGDFNQSLMELGATVCLPNGEPKCLECPLRELCRGHADGVAAELPQKAPKAARRREERSVVLLVSEGKIALRKRPDTGLLARLWEFPSLPGVLSGPEAKAALEAMGLAVRAIAPLKPARHVFSHVEWAMTGWVAELEAQPELPELIWAAKGELKTKYALPSAFLAYYQAALRL